MDDLDRVIERIEGDSTWNKSDEVVQMEVKKAIRQGDPCLNFGGELGGAE